MNRDKKLIELKKNMIESKRKSLVLTEIMSISEQVKESITDTKSKIQNTPYQLVDEAVFLIKDTIEGIFKDTIIDVVKEEKVKGNKKEVMFTIKFEGEELLRMGYEATKIPKEDNDLIREIKRKLEEKYGKLN